jgi:hypothetical protein
MNFTRHGFLVAFAVVTFPASILAYGPLGHQIVGAIADERLEYAHSRKSTTRYSMG